MNLIFFADLILLIHLLWVLAVVIPVPLILLGKVRHWRWIRNRRFRIIHLCMIGVVVVESLIGVLCPLTTWEQALRERANQPTYPGSFIRHHISRILFYEFPPWVFTGVYILFCTLAIALFKWIPPSQNHGTTRTSTPGR